MTTIQPAPQMLLVTVKAAAKMLSLGESTVYAMIAAGDLPYVAVGRVKRVALSDIDSGFALKAWPHVYAVGEMLDWEAPTGGYLLQACFSTAVAAARACFESLQAAPDRPHSLSN